MPLSEVRHLLVEEHVAVRANNATYIDPLQYVTVWERTDQGVDAQMPVGAPILAPCSVKILAVEPDWYAGQPLVYFELLDGPQAGQVQYVAEQITDIAQPGSILQQGQVVARYASRGTAIEYGWSTINGITLARATTGYEEGEITPAGQYMRSWLNSLGAGAGPWPPALIDPRATSQLRRPASLGSEVTNRGMSERAWSSASSSAAAASVSSVAPWPTSSIDGR